MVEKNIACNSEPFPLKDKIKETKTLKRGHSMIGDLSLHS